MIAHYAHVDAFARTALTGNPAAVLICETWPTDSVMQSLAAELAAPATAFVIGAGTEWAVRWFSPVTEISLCGHGGLAAGHVLLDRLPGTESVRLSTRSAGAITVARSGPDFTLSLPAITVRQNALGGVQVGLGAFRESWANSAGYTLLVFDSAEEIAALQPDFAALSALPRIQFTCTAPGTGHPSGADIVSRVFVSGPGAGEDSATGSAHAVLAPYWTKHLNRKAFSAHQASARGAAFDCVVDGDQVRLTGGCITLIQGTLRLP